jgi:GTP-binding protein
MQIISAEFKSSNTDISKLPPDDKPEFAFIGRSNVGKSSLLNMLVSRKALARISSTPGKTQTINHFLINNQLYFVDLPGYGFAKVSRSQRSQWEKMISAYLKNRKNLLVVFVLVDIRIPPQQNDVEMINRLGVNNLSVSIIYTKTDKLAKSKVPVHAAAIRNEILNYWETMPPEFFSSAETGAGRNEILKYVEESAKTFK